MSPETCRADLKRLINVRLLHLVGCLHRYTNDARPHKHQDCIVLFDPRCVTQLYGNASYLILHVSGTKDPRLSYYMKHFCTYVQVLFCARCCTMFPTKTDQCQLELVNYAVAVNAGRTFNMRTAALSHCYTTRLLQCGLYT